jgi:hypothetical protein
MLINEGTMTALCQQVWGKIKKIGSFLKGLVTIWFSVDFYYLRPKLGNNIFWAKQLYLAPDGASSYGANALDFFLPRT